MKVEEEESEDHEEEMQKGDELAVLRKDTESHGRVEIRNMT